ncbi:MAG: YfbK domain-containing protein [Ardenticatenaceae bacterium]
MKSKFLIMLSMLLSVLLVACGGAAEVATQAAPTEAPAPTEPRAIAPEPTEAPEAEAEFESEAAADEAGEEESVEEVAPEATPTDNFFKDYGVNPFVQTSEDNLSTFALDVDTASYSVARRYVEAGNLPPEDAVRVEEFVNYFDQGYDPPPDAAFSIYADGAPSPFHQDGTHFLRIGVQGYEVSEEERKPASLTFVIDVSGSMGQENRLGLVKDSLTLLVEQLRPSDSVAIVVYGSEARMVLPPTSGEDPGTIISAINSLQPEGSTNAEAGLQLAYEIANQAFLPNGINRVILCSDGVANVGATGPDGILSSIRRYADAGITLTSVGVGMGNFNDVMMEQLANDGDGFYAYVDTLEEAERLFVKDLTSTLQAIALDAKVQVDFNPEVVERYRLIGYENRDVADQDFRNDEVDAGEIGAGHTATAIYAVQLVPDASGRVGTVQLRWEDPDTHEVTEIAGDLNTSGLGTSFDETSPHYQLAVVVSQYAEALRGSPWAEPITIDQLAVRAERIAAQLDDLDVNEFATLVDQASRLRGGQ